MGDIFNLTAGCRSTAYKWISGARGTEELGKQDLQSTYFKIWAYLETRVQIPRAFGEFLSSQPLP